MNYRTVGVIGAGVIGGAINAYLTSLADIHLSFILVEAGFDETTVPLSMRRYITSDPVGALKTSPKLIIEAANPGVLARLGPQILETSDLCAFSCTALADAALEKQLQDIRLRSRRKLHIPHGAILALDGISDGKDFLQEVVITTTKNGSSLGVAAESEGIIFDGSTREACLRFPRNVNVHAAVALAGIGFDRTHSIIIADPATSEMRHQIRVSGQGFDWNIEVNSRSLGGVSGSYTPKSAVGSIQRLLGVSAVSNC